MTHASLRLARRAAALLLAALALAPWAAPRALAGPPPPATLMALPDIPGAVDGQVTGISDRGQIVGGYNDGTVHTFLLTR